ncbi:unnamed protein product, partial [Hymenolepis diminuta]
KFQEEVSILRELCGEKSSEFLNYFKHPVLNKRPDASWVDHVTRINKNFEQSDFISISSGHFKCLWFLAVCQFQMAFSRY